MGESERRRVTSIDVATESGVSQTTVARVFSSPEKVSPATRQHVQTVAARLGYVPNAIARSLKSQRTNIIGAVFPAHGEYWQGVLTAFSQELADRNQQLLLFSFSEPDRVNGILGAVEQYRLDGLILASANIGPEQMVRSGRGGLPVVAFNQPAAAGLLPSVSVDNEQGCADLAQHLVNAGARSVLFVGGVAAASTDAQRYRGAARALGAHGVACPYLEAGAYSYDAGYKAAGRMLEAGDMPDAVMVASDEVAFGVLDGLTDGGVAVPDDVLLTGFDGVPQTAWAGYDLTTLVQPIDELVRRATDLLLSARSADAGAEPDVIVPGAIRAGRSTDRSTGRSPANAEPARRAASDDPLLHGDADG
ncbi:MAG: LacI family DNA-binding transcriptional regulator [Actinomycetota bacterium]